MIVGPSKVDDMLKLQKKLSLKSRVVSNESGDVYMAADLPKFSMAHFCVSFCCCCTNNCWWWRVMCCSSASSKSDMSGLATDHNEMGGIVVLDPAADNDHRLPIRFSYVKKDFEDDITNGLTDAINHL